MWRTLPGWRQQASTLILSNLTCCVKRARAGPSIGSASPDAQGSRSGLLSRVSTLLTARILRQDIGNWGPFSGQCMASVVLQEAVGIILCSGAGTAGRAGLGRARTGDGLHASITADHSPS